MVDQAVRQVWTSRLDPLTTIRIQLSDAATPSRSQTVHIDAAGADRAALHQRYGHRPH